MHIDASIANKRVNWCLNRSSASHFGGVDESIIKSVQNFTNALIGNTDFNDIELMMDTEGLFISGLQVFQSGNHDNDIPLTAYHYLQGQIGGQFAPTSVDAAHFNPWKRRNRILELVWHKWMHVREWLPGQRVDEMAPGTPGYTDWRGRNRDLARYMYMYITGTRPKGRGVHMQIWTSAYHRDPVRTGYLGEIIGEARSLAVRIIHGPDRRTEKDVLNILNVSVHTEEKHRLAYSTY